MKKKDSIETSNGKDSFFQTQKVIYKEEGRLLRKDNLIEKVASHNKLIKLKKLDIQKKE